MNRPLLLRLLPLLLALTPAAAWAAPASWQLDRDPRSSAPRRLTGPAVALNAAGETELRREAFALLVELAPRLEVDPGHLDAEGALLVGDADGLRALHVRLSPGGVPLERGRASVILRGTSVLSVHVVGARTITADPRPLVDAFDAERLSQALTASAHGSLSVQRRPELLWLERPEGPRLGWRTLLRDPARPLRLAVDLDARTGELLDLRDETVEACDPLPAGGADRRVLGGVRPERADEPERLELLPFGRAAGADVGPDGYFPAGPPPYEAVLDGSLGRVECSGCTDAAPPRAPAGADGDAHFGFGGVDEAGNGTSTPADRAVWFHVEGVRRQAARWVDLPWFSESLPLRTNLPAACNAYWDGEALNFYRSDARCGNTGEIRDVIAHEWGHGLDDNDGLPTFGLSVDAATGEAVGDLVAMLRSRDACIGESFFRDAADWPSATCSGVRDLDELAPGHRRGTLDSTNALSLCPPSGYYRGPLGREGHCEGELLGQAAWHLVQSLILGASYGDGTPLGAALPEDEAWELLERLFYESRPILASQAPSTQQSLGVSAHEAFLLADDEGDGLGDGTPHAAFINEAFAHHGLAEPGLLVPVAAAACTPPPVATHSVSGDTDPRSGRPALRVTWLGAGTAEVEVLRADGPDEAFLRLSPPLSGDNGVWLDRSVLPGRDYRYRIVLTEGLCSSSTVARTARAGAELAVAGLRVDDTAGGDGDAVLEPGETASLFVDLANVGAAPLSNALVTLEANDPALVLLDPGPLAWGDLAPGATVPAPGPFTVRADPGVRRLVELVLRADADEGCHSATAVLELGVPDLAVASWSLDDTAGGDGDGGWQAGESVELLVALDNLGRVDADPVSGRLSFRAPVPGVSFVRDTASWGLVPPRAVGRDLLPPPFALAADAAVPPRTPVPLLLEVLIGADVRLSQDLDLEVGGLPPGALDWSYTEISTGSVNGPLVVQLNDDDGDGRVTRCDIPDVVQTFSRPTGRAVVALSGLDASLLWDVQDECTDIQFFSNLAAGDIDGDGLVEIVTGTIDRHACALNNDGTRLWRTAGGTGSPTPITSAQIHDLDGDGLVEVIHGASILDGRDGTTKWTASPGAPRALVADLDLDGSQEVAINYRWYRADGTVHAAGGTAPNLAGPGLVANFDDDPFPETLSGRDVLRVLNHDGSLLWERNDFDDTTRPWGPPCAADFDGDGRAEVAVASPTLLTLFDDDGTTLWTTPGDDDSGAAGCSIFDFDRDGVPEVVYQDQSAVHVFDGRDGTELWSAAMGSGTAYEYPFVADVDGDGSAEILVAGSASPGPSGVHAFGNPRWSQARGVWNQEDYSIVHVGEVGEVLNPPLPSWLGRNDFRAQAPLCPCDGPRPELSVSFPECSPNLACFTASVGGGLAPHELEWDFGDGSPPVRGGAPCHVFPGPGDWPVRLVLTDARDCPGEGGLLVHVRDELRVDFPAPEPCVEGELCVSGTVTGGLEPVELSWDFGDGGGLESGGDACRLLVPGPHVITLFARDANGCRAERARTVELVRRDSLPELSAAGSAEPLLVSRESGALRLRFENAALDADLHRGTVDGLWTSGYDHAMAACRIAGGSVLLPPVPLSSYFLAVAGACEAPRSEGPAGFDSAGNPRPASAASCP